MHTRLRPSRPDHRPAVAVRAGRGCRVLLAAGIAALAGACVGGGGGVPPTTFDLSAPNPRLRGGAVAGQVVVPEPTTIQLFEQDRIIVKDAAGAVSFVGGGQWADRLPRLIQARLIQTFENGSRLRAISRPGDRITADFQLNTEIRSFLVNAPAGEAVVEISAKVVNDQTGRIATARVFTARVPVATVDAATAARALDEALSTVLLDIVRWVGASGGSA